MNAAMCQNFKANGEGPFGNFTVVMIDGEFSIRTLVCSNATFCQNFNAISEEKF